MLGLGAATRDPDAAALIAQLHDEMPRKVEAKDRVIAARDQALAAAEAIIVQLQEALRLECVRKYGKQSEKLSDLQLQFAAADSVLKRAHCAQGRFLLQAYCRGRSR